VEVEHRVLVHLHVDVDVWLLGLELLAHDGALQDLRGGDDGIEGGGRRMPAGSGGRAADVDSDDQVGLTAQDVEGERVHESAVHQHVALADDGGEDGGQRDAGGDGREERPALDDELLLGVEVRREHAQRDRQLGEIARHALGQDGPEHRFRIQQRVPDRQDVQQPEDRLSAGGEE
jgi:hypothetical protein